MTLRETGIDIIGDVPWGTHICFLYNSKEEIFEIVGPYIKEGLNNNELCVWIYSDNTSFIEAKDSIKEHVLDVDQYIEKGQLRIFSYKEWYLINGSFNEKGVIRRWDEIYEYAVNYGYDGLRVAGDTSWLRKDEFRIFAKYEKSLNRIVPRKAFIVNCLYDINKSAFDDYIEIVRDHGIVITKGNNGIKVLKNIELLVRTQQLEQSRKNYKNLLRILPDAIFIHDSHAVYYCNEAAANLVGMDSIRGTVGKSMLDFIPDEKQDAYCRFIDQVIHINEGTNLLECSLLKKNGAATDVEVVGTKYLYNGHPTVLAVIRDISHLKTIIELEKNIKENTELLNETLEYDQIKTEFFSNITHEFRTPINVILAAIQLIYTIKQDSLDEKEKNCLNIMKQNCYRLLRLSNNLIDINKIDSDYFELKLVNCNIVEVVEAITLSIAEYIESKGITITFDTDTEEKTIVCDPEQIERVLLNLLSNAVKFTHSEGRILVKLSDYGNKVVITVKDNGIGIPDDKQKTIFERFQQVNKSLSRQSEGSGIGLSLVKSLIEKHGGRIKLNSKLGVGSEFIFEIPCKPVTGKLPNLSSWSCMSKHNFVESARIEFSDIYS